MKHIIISFVLITGFQTVFAQWTKGKGNGYFKASVWYLEADKHYTSNGETDPNATRGNFFTNLYGEYGITNKLDAIAFFPVFARVTQNDQVSSNGSIIQEGEAINSIGDLEIGARYGIIQKEKLVLSASLLLGIPTGEDKGGFDGSFQTGDGEFNQLLRVDLGVPFTLFKKSAYFKTNVGFNNRTDGFSDEFRIYGEVGVNISKEKLWVSTRINVVESFQNGDLNATNSQGSIFANNIEFVSVGLETSYYIQKNWGITAHLDSAISGRLIYAAPAFGGGIFYELK